MTFPAARHALSAAEENNGLQALLLDPLAAQNHLKSWHELASRSLDPNPFFAPDFLIPYMDNMGHSGLQLCVIRETESQDWLMAAPMARRKQGLAVPAATSWATEYGPLGIPLLAPDAPAGTVPAFLSLAARSARLPLIAFPYMPLDSDTAEAIRSAEGWTVHCGQEAYRAAHDSGEEGERQFAKAYSGKRRKELPRLIRRLSALGEVQFASHSGKDSPHHFENFLQLEASGWKGKNGTALLSTHQTAAFAREMVSKRATYNGVRIDSITVSGHPIAMLVLLSEAGRIFSWKIAFDEEYGRYSPGAQITLFAFEQSLSDPSISGGDSLAIPGHPMIEPLWRGRMRYGTLLCSRSGSGRMLQEAATLDLALNQNLRRFARKLLRRKG